jgi:hypothetical protein
MESMESLVNYELGPYKALIKSRPLPIPLKCISAASRCSLKMLFSEHITPVKEICKRVRK